MLNGNYTQALALYNTEDAFKLPIYQRKYAWLKEDCVKFLEKLSANVNNNKKYLLGTLLLQDSNNRVHNKETYMVIDGQQRMTTLYLFLLAMYEKLSKQEDMASQINAGKLRNYLVLMDAKTMKFFTRIQLMKDDKEVLDKLVNSVVFGEEIDDKAFDRIKGSKLWTNYTYFCEYLRNEDANKLYGYMDSVVWTITALDGTFDAQDVFENLNTGGRTLTLPDKLKNRLFLGLAENTQRNLYTKYWATLEKQMSVEEFEQFLQYYAMYILGDDDVSKDSTYSALGDYYSRNGGDGEDHVKHLYKYSKYFRSYIGAERYFKIKDVRYEKFENLASLLANKFKWRSGAVIYFYFCDQLDAHNLDIDTALKCLEMFLNYYVRSIFVKGTHVIHAQYSVKLMLALCKVSKYEYRNEILKALWGLPGNYSYSEDSEIRDFAKHYNPSADKMRLALLLVSNNLPDYDISKANYTLERIMPKKLDNAWISMLGDVDNSEYVNKFGNMTLLTTAENSKCLNRSFAEKQEVYINSQVTLTQDVAANYDVWNFETIKNRTTLLLNEMLYAYPQLQKPDEVMDLSKLPQNGLLNVNVKIGNTTKTYSKRDNLIVDLYQFLIKQLTVEKLNNELSSKAKVLNNASLRNNVRLGESANYVSKEVFKDKKAALNELQTVLTNTNLADKVIKINS